MNLRQLLFLLALGLALPVTGKSITDILRNQHPLMASCGTKVMQMTDVPELAGMGRQFGLNLDSLVWEEKINAAPLRPGVPSVAWTTRRTAQASELRRGEVGELTYSALLIEKFEAPKMRIQLSIKRSYGSLIDEIPWSPDFLTEMNQAVKARCASIEDEMSELVAGWYLEAVKETGDSEALSREQFAHLIHITVAQSGRAAKSIALSVSVRSLSRAFLELYRVMNRNLNLE